jgi:toxin ParE1/3/4
MPKVYQRASARRDLVEHFVCFAENASLETAERFLSKAKATFDVLASQPLIGARLESRHPIWLKCAVGGSKDSVIT